MEAAVDKWFTDDLLEKFLQLFALEKNVKKLGDFENYVFEVYREGIPYILRISHSSHRTDQELLSEIDWVDFLYSESINVPKTLKSVNENYIEAIQLENGSQFYCSLFTKAPGNPVIINDKNFNAKLFFSWGKTVGKMHKASQAYKRREGIKPRLQWDEEELLIVENNIPAEQNLVINNSKKLVQTIKALNKDKHNFGLIHSDLHTGNFFYDGEKIHTFDFDDCCYMWFASDIAIPLYYSALNISQNVISAELNEFAEKFLNAFMDGYQTENIPPENWREQLPLFLKLRDVTLYSVLHKKTSPKYRNERMTNMLFEIRSRIEKNIAIVEL